MKLLSKNSPRSYFIFACVLFLGAIGFSMVYKYIHNPDRLIRQFGKQLNRRYDENEAFLYRITDTITSPSYDNLSRFSDLLKKDYSLYVYRDSQLFYWSDNSINPELCGSPSGGFPRLYKAGNGIYQISFLKKKNSTYLLADLVKSGYSYQNEYLLPEYNPVYHLPAEFNLSLSPGGVPVNDQTGHFLLSINYKPDALTFSSSGILFLFTLYLAALIVLIAGIYQLYLIYTPIKRYPLLILLFLADIVIIRVVILYFRIPSTLYASELFSPVSFAYSSFLPSLGDFLTDALLAATAAVLIYATYRKSAKELILKPLFKVSLRLIFTTVAAALFYLCCYLLNILINNSAFSLDLSNISDFTPYGILAHFIIFFLLVAFFFTTYTLYNRVFRLSGWKRTAVYFLLVNLICYIGSDKTGLYHPDYTLLGLQAAYFICLLLIFTGTIRYPHLSSISSLVLILTLVSSYSLYINKIQKERNERKLIALRLSSDRDKMGEFLFNQIETRIHADSTLSLFFKQAWLDPQKENQCIDYVKSTFFRGYWSRYNIQITLCFPEKSLQIRPSNYIIGCHDYFSDIILSLGEATVCPSLFFIRESYDASSYIANIPMGHAGDAKENAYLVVELSPKYVPKGLGYPELLMDKASSSKADISGYSYAIFYRDELVKNVGEYNYGVNEAIEIAKPSDFRFYDRNGFNHLYHTINQETSIIISRKNDRMLDRLSPFTYQLIFHILLLILAAGIYNLRYIGRKRSLDFKTRLQLMVVTLVLFASLTVGLTTLFDIRNLNNKKNQDMLSEKSHSVLIELENKLAMMDILDKSQKTYLEELLTKFSLVFFSDINLYDINGHLLATSRPQIFEEGLKSELMSAGPYQQLAIHKRTLFIDNEKIGTYRYLSAYLPFRNEQNKLTAYINLPYFAREQELRQEISSFLIAFVNIYVILTVLAVFISILAGNYLMRPLQLIRNRFSSINLGRENEKISYSRQDELGDLINEYNLMIDKLTESAEKLARSERESAWREMARQVAHEIKNPLTPMKLSIQHLHKSWMDKKPDWENRLEKTTQTLIEQIDSLASIAGAFSDFAQLPVPSNKKTELTSIIRKTIALFNQHPETNFSFTLPEQKCFVFADEKQLSRAFINLFNNAVQAMPAKHQGQVTITLETTGSFHQIEIRDNGCGIEEEKKGKIFSPNFTTKSGGMGLGLAMVKNIIDSAGGTISFTSEKGTGTAFFIELPAVNE